MLHTLVARVRTTWLSNAWTRTRCEPAAARRIAGLRYWDGCVS
jgi:hypothetical protein